MTLSEAQRALVVQWMPLGRRLTRGFVHRHPHLEPWFDDLLQCAWLALCRAGAQYRPGSSAQFQTYAGTAMTNALLQWGRRLRNVVAYSGFVSQDDAADLETELVHHDDLDGVDAHRVWAAAVSEVAERIPVPRSFGGAVRNPERDAAIFIANCFGGEDHRSLGRRYGLSLQGSVLAARRAERGFEAWAADVRREAA
jgi:DNA-directed RNA polymerase specialized sigma24 family protein